MVVPQVLHIGAQHGSDGVPSSRLPCPCWCWLAVACDASTREKPAVGSSGQRTGWALIVGAAINTNASAAISALLSPEMVFAKVRIRSIGNPRSQASAMLNVAN